MIHLYISFDIHDSFFIVSSSFPVSVVFRLNSLLVQSLLFQMETLLARNCYARNRSKIFSLISVGNLFLKSILKYSMCVTYLITVKLVRDEDVKPRVHSRFLVFSFRGVWGHCPPENFENEMLRNAISGHFCDIFVKKFSSLHPVFTCLQYQWN